MTLCRKVPWKPYQPIVNKYCMINLQTSILESLCKLPQKNPCRNLRSALSARLDYSSCLLSAAGRYSESVFRLWDRAALWSCFGGPALVELVEHKLLEFFSDRVANVCNQKAVGDFASAVCCW
jgi:hypothetical protein